jgi:hypothetical protein
MSTPSVKPFNPFDLSPYAPKRVRRQASEHPAAEDEIETVVRWPLAGASEPAAGDSQDAGVAALSSSPEPDAAQGSAQDSNQESQHPIQGSATDPAEEPAGAEAAELADAAESRDPNMDRLESSLRWLQREGAVKRMPRAVQLPPVAGLRSFGDGRTRDDQFINGIRVPPSLAPERLRPPPEMRDRRDHLRAPLRVLVASLIAAPIAYYFSAGALTTSSQPPRETQVASQVASREPKLASIASRVVTSDQFPLPKDEVRPAEAEDYNSMLSSRNRAIPASAASTSVAVPTSSVAAPPVDIPAAAVAEPAPAQAAPAEVTRELDPEAIRLLLQKGEQYVAAGDLVTARQVYRRAAEAGSASAALAMGATYDPTVLARLGIGISPDPGKAREWYEKARVFGSPDAARRIETLAVR